MLLSSYSKGWTSPHNLWFVRKNLWIFIFILRPGGNSQNPVHSVVFRVKSLQHWFDLATDNWLTKVAKCQKAVFFLWGIYILNGEKLAKKNLLTHDPKYFSNCVICFGYWELGCPLPAMQNQCCGIFIYSGAEGTLPPFASLTLKATAFYVLEKRCKLQQQSWKQRTWD